MSKVVRLRHSSFSLEPFPVITVRRMTDQGTIVPHQHDFLEIAIILSGQALHVTGEVRHPVQAGDVLVIHSSRIHSYENTRALYLANILIREDLFREIEKELGSLPGYHALFTLEPMRWRQSSYKSHLRLPLKDLRAISLWIDALEEETKRSQEGGRFLARSWLHLIIGMLSRRYGAEMSRVPHMEMPMARVMSWMDEHDSEPVSVKGLARRAAMSERTFQRHFREATGFSPMDYLIRARIRRAQEWLVQPQEQLPVTEIAFRCGFQDSNYFTRQFRRCVGLSPRQYRAQLRPAPL